MFYYYYTFAFRIYDELLLPIRNQELNGLRGIHIKPFQMQDGTTQYYLDFTTSRAFEGGAKAKGIKRPVPVPEKFALELKEFREEELDEFKDFAESEVNESIKYINDLYKDYQNKNKELAKETAAVEKAEQDKIRELLRQTRIDAQLTNQAFTSTLNV